MEIKTTGPAPPIQMPRHFGNSPFAIDTTVDLSTQRQRERTSRKWEVTGFTKPAFAGPLRETILSKRSMSCVYVSWIVVRMERCCFRLTLRFDGNGLRTLEFEALNGQGL